MSVYRPWGRVLSPLTKVGRVCDFRFENSQRPAYDMAMAREGKVHGNLSESADYVAEAR